MNKLSKKYSKLLILISIALVFITIPVKAAVRNQPNSSQTKIDRTHLALWSELMRRLGRRRRNGGSRGPTCLIAPQRLDDPISKVEINEEVWSLNPLFLWNIEDGEATKIELFEKGRSQALWSKEIPKGATSIVYDGEPLKPGNSYEWQIVAKAPFEMKSISAKFKMMESQKRFPITIRLALLENNLKQQGADAEKIALEKANYLAQKQLWSDVVGEIYKVKNPSIELRRKKQQLQSSEFCN
ncbi:MAG: hypothetical protein AAFV71_17355 [Cyanobacteria bacterium J06633_8]